jgi:BirA family biotin operon repressor/biotin-[acetyl-CoA-carboxylase] ligase
LNHHHFKSIGSTQENLLTNPDNIDLSQDVLISCDEQLTGHGQYKRQWDSYDGSLCFSFTIEPNPILTLTSLEMACIIHKFFFHTKSVNLKLKWPNDLLTREGYKVGGIIINNTNKKNLIVGVGLNYSIPKNINNNYRTKAGGIFKDKIDINKKAINAKIYNYILRNRVNDFEVMNYWNKQCIHIDKEVTFLEDGKTSRLLFKGIGKNGEAIVVDDKKYIQHKFSGTIILD